MRNLLIVLSTIIYSNVFSQDLLFLGNAVSNELYSLDLNTGVSTFDNL
jgi:hypothetical protein